MEQQYTIWTILGYRMMYPVYGTILLLTGLYIANNKRYRNARKALLKKFSDNSLIVNLVNCPFNEDSDKYENLSFNFNEIAGYRYLDLLTINREAHSCVF